MNTITDRDLDIEFFVNVWKDMYGFKPRHLAWDSLSDEEIRAEVVALHASVAAQEEAEAFSLMLDEEEAHYINRMGLY